MFLPLFETILALVLLSMSAFVHKQLVKILLASAKEEEPEDTESRAVTKHLNNARHIKTQLTYSSYSKAIHYPLFRGNRFFLNCMHKMLSFHQVQPSLLFWVLLLLFPIKRANTIRFPAKHKYRSIEVKPPKTAVFTICVSGTPRLCWNFKQKTRHVYGEDIQRFI